MHIFGTTATLNPNNAAENLKSVLIEGDLEVRNEAFFGGATNYSKRDSSGILTHNGTARWDMTQIPVNGITKTRGTSPDTVADLNTLSFTGTDNTYTLTEEGAGQPGFDVTFDYASVTAFNFVRLLASYQGNAAHFVQVLLEITPFNGTVWHILNTLDHHSAVGLEDYSFFVPDSSIYINSGVVKLRLYHPTNGTVGHTIIIDECTLYQ